MRHHDAANHLRNLFLSQPCGCADTFGATEAMRVSHFGGAPKVGWVLLFRGYSYINYLISPHRSPHMGKTPPHLISYIDGEEMNDQQRRGKTSIERKGTERRMNETHTFTENPYEPGQYEIRIKGHLDDRRTAGFEGLTVTREDSGCTKLTGRFDQAALHGLLRKVRDLGMPLLSVTQVQFNPTHPDRSQNGDKP